MSINYEQVLADVLDLLNRVKDDWEYSGTITAQTGLISDLGFESLELVVLGGSIQEHYKQTLPFPQFLAELGERKVTDIYVSDLVDFVHRHVGHAVV